MIASAGDLDDEIQIAGLVHELEAIIGSIGEEMLDPGPSLADVVEDGVGARAVRNVCGGEVHHQQPAIGINGDVPLAPGNLLSSVKPARFCRWRLDRLTVNHLSAQTGLPPLALTIQQQLNVMDRLEQAPARQFEKPAINRLLCPEMDRQHAPATAPSGPTLTTSRKSTSRRRPRRPGLGINGARRSHSSSVRSLE